MLEAGQLVPEGIRFTSVLDKDALVLRAEITVLLAKDAIQLVPLFEMRSGFYSPYFIVPTKGSSLVPLREAGIRILNYLDDWLILAQSCAQLCKHRDMVLSHLSRLGLWVNWEKSKLSPVQRIYFLSMELDSVNLTARLSIECAQSMLNCLESFQRKRAVPLKKFQRLLGHMASAAAVMPLRLLHMRPLQRWLHDRVPRWAWRRGTYWVSVTPSCHQTFSPWSDIAFFGQECP